MPAAVPGMRDSSCASGGTDSSSALVERERSPPANRRALARTPRKASSPYPSGNIPTDGVSAAPAIVHNQMLNIGASPQQVLAAQQFAAGEAANRVAAQAELLHQASMSEVQGQVRDVLSEAGSAEALEMSSKELGSVGVDWDCDMMTCNTFCG